MDQITAFLQGPIGTVFLSVVYALIQAALSLPYQIVVLYVLPPLPLNITDSCSQEVVRIWIIGSPVL